MRSERMKQLNDLISKKQLYYVLAIMVLGVCIVGGVVWKAQNQTKPVVNEMPLVQAAVVKVAESSQGYTYSGEVRGRYESQLAFQVDGKIIKRNIELGSIINAGDVLMQIDPKDIQQTVNSTSAQVYSAESQLRLAESNLNRYRQLYEQGAVGRMTYDQYASAYDVAVAALQQASAQNTQGTNKLDYSLLRADKSGIVSNISAEIGQVVSAGQTVLTIVQDGDREVEINVPENRIEELRKAQQLNVTFWALPELTITGKVREISPMADKVSRTYKVRISLVNPPQEINLGMTAAVTVNSTDNQKAAYIPLSALYQTEDTPNVWVIQNDIVTLRPIKIDVFGDNKVKVLEGLNDGDMIVTAGVHKLQEGQKVRTAGADQ